MNKTSPSKNLIPAQTKSLIEGAHPAPLLTFVLAAANIGFLIVFTVTHSPFWKGPDWLLFVLFPVFGVGFPLLFERLIRQQQLNLALRIAWNDFEDLVFEHLNTTIDWFRHSQKYDDVEPGWKDLRAFAGEYWMDILDALDLLPVALRYRLRRDLEKLPVDVVLWGYLKDDDPDCYLSERVYMDLHERYTGALRPDFTHAIIAVVISNLVGWWLMW